jgi:hypothetical protein
MFQLAFASVLSLVLCGQSTEAPTHVLVKIQPFASAMFDKMAAFAHTPTQKRGKPLPSSLFLPFLGSGF